MLVVTPALLSPPAPMKQVCQDVSSTQNPKIGLGPTSKIAHLFS